MRWYKIVAATMAVLMLASVIGSGAMAAIDFPDPAELDDEPEWIDISSQLDMALNDGYIENMPIEPLTFDLDIGGISEVYTTIELPENHVPTIRQRPIEMNPIFHTSKMSEDTTIVLNLFENATFTSSIYSMTEYKSGNIGMRGDIEGLNHSFVVLTVGEGSVLGTIEIPENNQKFGIRRNSTTGMHYVYEVDLFNIDVPSIYRGSDYGGVSETTIAEPYNHDHTSDLNIDVEIVIDVLVVYTPLASEWADWSHGIDHEIDSAMETANHVLQNSQTGLTLNLADSRLIDYEESGSPGADLMRLTARPGEEWDTYTDCPYNPGEEYDIGINPDSDNPELGYMPEVHDWRDETGADLVVFVPQIEHIWGSGWLLRNQNGSPDWGFSQTGVQYLSKFSTYTFIHEIGHNLGCHHNIEDAGEDDDGNPGQGFFEYSYGHRWVRLSGTAYRTVMAYQGTYVYYSRIPYFSDPDINYFLDPTGTEDANNSGTIRHTKHLVSSYRFRNTLEIGVNFEAGGTTDPPSGSYIYTGNPDTDVFPTESLTAIPNPGWEFSHWYGDVPDGQEENNPIDIYMDDDKSINAHFKHPFELDEWSIIGEPYVYPQQEVTFAGYVYNSGDVTYEDYIDLEIWDDYGNLVYTDEQYVTIPPGYYPFVTFSTVLEEDWPYPVVYDFHTAYINVRGYPLLSATEVIFFEVLEPIPAEFKLNGWSASVYPDSSVEIAGWVENVGGEIDTDWIDLYVNDMDNFYGSILVEDLRPGESVWIKFDYSPGHFSSGHYDIKVSPLSYPDEWVGEFEIPEPPLVVSASDNTTENSYGDHTYTFTVENTADTDGSITLEVDDTAGWPVSVEPSSFRLNAGQTQDVYVTVTIPDSVGDGEYTDITLTATGSPIYGGGCPYVSSWNGTDYQLDNNILIASEHQDGMVDDHYILQNSVEPKNGSYSLRIDEFENSKDHFDMVKLYTIDHQEGYDITTTPEGEIIAYREPRPALSAYDSDGEDVLGYLNTTGNGALSVDEDSWVILNFGEITKSQWEHNKLVVVSHGFESYTQPPSDIYPGPWLPIKESLYVSMRMDDSEWVDITVLHPRNNPSAMVIPLNETLEEFFPGRKGNILGELEVKIQTTGDHYIDFVGIDDTVPAKPMKVQEAALESALLNGEMDVTDLLSTNDTEMVSLIPGDDILLTFDIPKQSPAPVFSERSYMLYSRGYYELYESNNEVDYTVLTQTDTLLSNGLEASDTMRVTFEHTGSSVLVTAPSDATVTSTGTYTYYFSVKNTGNLNDVYGITVSNTGSWQVSAQSSVSLSAGQTKNVGVSVTIPSSAYSGQYTDITLMVTSQHGSQSDSDVMRVTYEYEPEPPYVEIIRPEDGSIFYEPASVVVEWVGESGIDNYWIYDGSWINVGTSTSYTLEGLTSGTHTITVRARKDGVYGYDSVMIIVESAGLDIQ